MYPSCSQWAHDFAYGTRQHRIVQQGGKRTARNVLGFLNFFILKIKDEFDDEMVI
jgi:hypothetical protein